MEMCVGSPGRKMLTGEVASVLTTTPTQWIAAPSEELFHPASRTQCPPRLPQRPESATARKEGEKGKEIDKEMNKRSTATPLLRSVLSSDCWLENNSRMNQLGHTRLWSTVS